MRAGVVLMLAGALGGCTRAEVELARLRAQVSLRDAPAADREPRQPPPARCTGAYSAHFPRHRLTELGGVTFADLGSTRDPWRYRRAGVYARHLSPKDPMREELLDNGAHLYAARFFHVMVPAGRTATITLNEPRLSTAAGLLPGGVTRFGGYLAADGELELRCEAGSTRTTYPLGIVVEEPRCVSLTVRLDGGAPVSRMVPFGRRSCP